MAFQKEVACHEGQNKHDLWRMVHANGLNFATLVRHSWPFQRYSIVYLQVLPFLDNLRAENSDISSKRLMQSPYIVTIIQVIIVGHFQIVLGASNPTFSKFASSRSNSFCSMLSIAVSCLDRILLTIASCCSRACITESGSMWTPKLDLWILSTFTSLLVSLSIWNIQIFEIRGLW